MIYETIRFIDCSEYVGGVKDGKPNAYGSMTYANGDKYTGEFKDGKRDGIGEFNFGSGKYRGEFKDDLMHGYGVLIFSNSGTRQVGEWRENHLNGQAAVIYADGSVSIGKYIDDKVQTEYIHLFADKTKKVFDNKYLNWGSNYANLGFDENRQEYFFYVGEMNESGHPSGRGTEIFNYDKSLYVGEFDHFMNGQGIFLDFVEGSKYDGRFSCGKKCGQGTYTNSFGKIYIGEWIEDKKNGQGTEIDTGGYKYVGAWKDDKKHGQGTLTYSDGTEKTGEWIEDDFTGFAEVYYGLQKDGGDGKYYGSMRGGKRDGEGTMTYRNGDKYEGGWKDDKYSGQGTLTFANGKKKTGEWKDGRHIGLIKKLLKGGRVKGERVKG